ncbi:hypothetical protein N7495_000313 [Penicillium taxi]|uniref:uncharacterized protein n=1 Tax=Penicillium taxi TaxID=168475 RepID=UPI00254597B1|nr:uncharacterized protein N7495_000313 [Penicillium taxi]KAJ5907631.1 hypothetical protein N7495_000313 [Penicillium taxi]
MVLVRNSKPKATFLRTNVRAGWTLHSARNMQFLCRVMFQGYCYLAVITTGKGELVVDDRVRACPTRAWVQELSRALVHGSLNMCLVEPSVVWSFILVETNDHSSRNEPIQANKPKSLVAWAVRDDNTDTIHGYHD